MADLQLSVRARRLLDVRAVVGGLAGVMLAGTPGCSFIFTQGPRRDYREHAYVDCSTTMAPPVIDTIFGGLLGIGAAVVATSPPGRNQSDGNHRLVSAIAIAEAAVAAGSAVYGYQRTAACRNAKAQVAKTQTFAPPPGPWPPPGPPAPQPPERP